MNGPHDIYHGKGVKLLWEVTCGEDGEDEPPEKRKSKLIQPEHPHSL